MNSKEVVELANATSGSVLLELLVHQIIEQGFGAVWVDCVSLSADNPVKHGVVLPGISWKNELTGGNLLISIDIVADTENVVFNIVFTVVLA